MSNKLDEIRKDLDDARKLVRKAGNIAKEAGDGQGSQNCGKVAERIDELHDSFPDKDNR